MIEASAISIQAGQYELRRISFRIESGQYAVMMGRTGIGKTTILEAICGLRKVHSGIIRINGQDVTRWTPAERQLGYMPQDLALFPTMTVRRNIEFSLRVRRQPEVQRKRRVEELAGLLRIEHLLERSTEALSGGEAQRVALARALAGTQTAILLDEPISALDRQTRQESQQLLKEINRQTGVTFLHVTHNEEEADALADIRLLLEQDSQTGLIGIREA